MNKCSLPIQLATALAVGALAPIGASAAPAAAAVTVTVHGDHYAVGTRAFHRLGALEEHVLALRPGMLRVQACGQAALRPWKAVVYRHRHLPLELSVDDAKAHRCEVVPRAFPAASRPGDFGADIDDGAMDRYWQKLTP